MSTRAPKIVRDGWISQEGGIDNGVSPSLIQPNQAAFAVNTTFRYGWPQPRPGWRKITINWQDSDDDEEAFKNALFQCAGGYVSDNRSGSLISMHGGKVFRVKLDRGTNFTGQNISISGDLNPSNREEAWCAQGENFFVVQDGQSLPFIYNGASARRANEDEIPAARQIVYYMGRFWVARGREYLGGDIVFGPSGTAGSGFRDSVLKFTEAQYLTEGGSFGVPSDYGDITAMKPIGSINTALGQGEMIVYTDSGAFATVIPQDRSTWKTTTQLLQRVIQLEEGAFSQSGVASHNEDHFYRSRDGVRSLVYAVRNSGDPGNSSISAELGSILDNENEEWLRFGSAVAFDNRLLVTASQGFVQGRGVYHRGVVALDFDPNNSVRRKLPPAWDGLWTGLNILRLVTVKHFGVKRCFAYVLNAQTQIELWEMTKDEKNDNDSTGDQRITWSVDSRSMPFGGKFDRKRLESADVFYDRLSGTVDFTAKYRPDNYPCWISWQTWQECAKTSLCNEDIVACQDLPNLKEQYRLKKQLLQPSDDFDPITKQLYRVGCEFQARTEVTGFCRLKQFRLNAREVEEQEDGQQL